MILTRMAKANSFLWIVLLVGCIPYRSAWEADRNQLIGKEIYLERVFDREWYMTYGDRFYSLNGYKALDRSGAPGFDNIKYEEAGARYYITFRGGCKYSILLDSRNVMVSWRYEADKKSCFYF